MRSSSTTLCSRGVQVLLCLFGATIIVLLLVPNQGEMIYRTRQLYNINQEDVYSREDYGAPPASRQSDDEEIADYRLCSPLKPFRMFVYANGHALAKALSKHPAATENSKEACFFIAFSENEGSTNPAHWNITGAEGANHLMISLGEEPMERRGREWIGQEFFPEGQFRTDTDFALYPGVLPFDAKTYLSRPSIMPLKRETHSALVVDAIDKSLPASIKQVVCEGDCAAALSSISFCLLPSSPSLQLRLLQVLRAACVPVVLSTRAPLPFQNELDWKLAALRFPPSMVASVPEILEEIVKEDLMEMRRRGKVFLARIDDAEALSKSLVAAVAQRLHLTLPAYPEVQAKLIAPNDVFKNISSKTTRIRSPFGAQTLTSSRLYSHSRWNSGRDLTYAPRALHDVPMMPGEAGFYEGTKEHLVSVDGQKRLGLTRDEDQFTVMILTYNRDNGVQKIIERLRNCPYLNKIIIVWNNQERRPNGTWPEIHVPIEFFLSPKNSLNSRFLPYDMIETDAVVSIDDDMDLGQPEITFAFRMWRENRDRVVGFPERYHKFKDGVGKYGLSGACEHSMILTSFAFFHKEFLFEYTYNQHPVILDFIEQSRNCEDIAINYLVSHLTRKPPLKVVKKASHSNGAKSGLSARGNHYRERDGCVAMFNKIYGYSPLLFSQEVAKPSGKCVEGL